MGHALLSSNNEMTFARADTPNNLPLPRLPYKRERIFTWLLPRSYSLRNARFVWKRLKKRRLFVHAACARGKRGFFPRKEREQRFPRCLQNLREPDFKSR